MIRKVSVKPKQTGEHVCSVCGCQFPARFTVKHPDEDKHVCLVCGYDCMSKHNGDNLAFESDVYQATSTKSLSDYDVRKFASAMSKHLKADPMAMNEFDDFTNVGNQIIIAILTGRAASVEERFDKQCDISNRIKFKRRIHTYLDVDAVEEQIGCELTFDNFETVLLPHLQNQVQSMRVFKLVKPKLDEIKKYVEYSVNNSVIDYDHKRRNPLKWKIQLIIEETPKRDKWISK